MSMSDARWYFFLQSRSRSRSHGSGSCQIWPNARWIGSDRLMELNRGFHTMSIWDPLHGVTDPEFSNSSQELGHVTPNLCYLAKSTKCTVHFLGHEIRCGDETRYMGRCRWVMHDGNFFPRFKVEVKVMGVRNFTAVRKSSNMASRQMDRLRQGQWNWIGGFILWVLGTFSRA